MASSFEPPGASESAPAPLGPLALARAPRAQGGDAPRATLLLPPPALQGAVLAVIWRDTRGCVLSDAQRLTHFPASPLVGISWFPQGGEVVGLLERGRDGASQWRPFDSAVVVAGSQLQPQVSWSPRTGCGGTLCCSVEAARLLFGIDPAVVHDRVLPAEQVVDASWAPLFAALQAAPDVAAALQALEQHAAPRWQALRGRVGVAPSLQQFTRYWVNRLAWQAQEWHRTHGPRQVERRIKAFSGRSLRDWQALVRSDSAFYTLRDRLQAGRAPDWAALAQDEGFADQAHLVRTVRRITGFAPGEFVQRFTQDESFWLYRLWV